jgi:hypothetical protein
MAVVAAVEAEAMPSSSRVSPTMAHCAMASCNQTGSCSGKARAWKLPSSMQREMAASS